MSATLHQLTSSVGARNPLELAREVLTLLVIKGPLAAETTETATAANARIDLKLTIVLFFISLKSASNVRVGW
jgi:hypothetical protein